MSRTENGEWVKRKLSKHTGIDQKFLNPKVVKVMHSVNLTYQFIETFDQLFEDVKSLNHPDLKTMSDFRTNLVPILQEYLEMKLSKKFEPTTQQHTDQTIVNVTKPESTENKEVELTREYVEAMFADL